MEQLKEWAVNVCITLIATGVFSMLIPQGNMEKVMKFGVSTFFLCCLLLPFFTGMPKLNWKTEVSAYTNTEQIENKMEQQLEQLSKTNIEQVISGLLASEGIQPEKIEADIHISENNSVSINRVTVVLNNKGSSKENKVKGLIQKKTGIDAVVISSGKATKDGN